MSGPHEFAPLSLWAARLKPSSGLPVVHTAHLGFTCGWPHPASLCALPPHLLHMEALEGAERGCTVRRLLTTAIELYQLTPAGNGAIPITFWLLSLQNMHPKNAKRKIFLGQTDAMAFRSFSLKHNCPKFCLLFQSLLDKGLAW